MAGTTNTSKTTISGDNTKRIEGVISWQDYFMGVAFLSGKRSKDPSTQVGACIVNDAKRIVGIGYNGMPDRCSDDDMPWKSEDKDKLNTKNMYVCHAEMNAIVNSGPTSVRGCSIYVSLFPCNECSKLIIQSGIKEVFYYPDKRKEKDWMVASKRLLDQAKVKYEAYRPKETKMMIDFECNSKPKSRKRPYNLRSNKD